MSCKDDSYKNVESLSNHSNKNGFVGSNTCAACHSEVFEEWKGSHHDLSMQIAKDSTVLGDFNDAKYESKGVSFKFFKRGDSFFVNTEGEGGKYADYEITHTFGVYPLQQYLIKFPNGKFQCLLAAWDSENNLWFDLQPNLKTHHEEWLHWTGGSMTWNNMCADCHSTNLRKNYNQTSQSYNTTYDIINVSCEACHGPSSNHVDYYNGVSKLESPPELYMVSDMSSEELVQKCARCHSRRAQLTEAFDYKGDFLDHYTPFLLNEPEYELDGQIKDEVYVYGSFVQSKMYQEGVSCNDCHNPHTLKLKKTGNTLCLSCHEPSYNEQSHHFHKIDTEAALCISCHMTGKTYMGNDFRRDHSFRVPRPDQSAQYGTPNACNSCHTDKTAEWAAEAIVKNYGDERPPHFSDKMLEGYHSDISAFYDVFSNPEHPGIVRATALNRYSNRRLSPEEIETVNTYLADLNPLVRNEAVLGLSRNINKISADLMESLLLDSLRTIRISTAALFKQYNESVFLNEEYKQAEKDYFSELRVNSDFASGQHKIGVNEQIKGNIDKAIESYYKALEIDNYYNMSRTNLALLEYNRGNKDVAEKLYLKIIEQEPNFSHSYLMLGLLYNENGKVDESLKYLKLACEKEPKNERAYYNYAIKLQEINLMDESLKVIQEGLTYFPKDENLLYSQVIIFINKNRINEARRILNVLLEIAPTNQRYITLSQRLNN